VIEQGRAVLWVLRRPDSDVTVRGELVGFVDGVELELYRDTFLRHRWRFLRDGEARRYAERVRARLVARGYEQRRRLRV
jgi:hypothetical protein